MPTWLIAALIVVGSLSARTAYAETVDLRLVLAADVSISVDDEEFRLQREGYATAITSVPVLQAIQAGPHRAIAVTFIEWSGPFKQRVVVDWTVIRDGEMATDVTTPTRLPSSSRLEPAAGHADRGSSRSPLRIWLTCPNASIRATVSWPR